MLVRLRPKPSRVLAALADKVDWLASLPSNRRRTWGCRRRWDLATGANGALGRCIGRERAKGWPLDRVRQTSQMGPSSAAAKSSRRTIFAGSSARLRAAVLRLHGRGCTLHPLASVLTRGCRISCRMSQILALSASSDEWWLAASFHRTLDHSYPPAHGAGHAGPLDELVLTVSMQEPGATAKSSDVTFKVKGLQIEGAAWSQRASLSRRDRQRRCPRLALVGAEKRRRRHGLGARDNGATRE